MDRFQFERDLLNRGIKRIAGVDEAGRGPLAGPVVAAAAVLPPVWMESGLPVALRGLNDSKQLSATQREKFFAFLASSGEFLYGVAVIEAQVIDTINILRATHQAMREALEELRPAPDHVLVDGLPVPSLRLAHTSLVRGDARSYSIAAASILAKVSRDRLMLEYDRQYPLYGFAEHKGYGTPRHLAALADHGPCPIHRRSFAPLKEPEPELFASRGRK